MHVDWKSIVRSFFAVQGAVIGTASLLLSVFLYAVIPGDYLFRVLVAIISLLLILLALVTLTFLRVVSSVESFSVLPRIRSSIDPFDPVNGEFVCLTDPSTLFAAGIFVSFFKVDAQGFERPIGIGRVANVQEDGKIAVEMLKSFDSEREFVDQLKANNVHALEFTRIKPYISQHIFGLIQG